jgi:uncharacterized protein YdeI (BOF family)
MDKHGNLIYALVKIFFRSVFMKKIVLLLAIGMLLFSGTAFGQTAQGANTTGGTQGNSSDNFGRGGYTGPVLGSITIEALRDSAANAFVIVEGYLIQQRVPGTYILANTAQNPTVSVVIHINPYFWSNLQIDANTPVLVYGTVNRSELRIEIEATRIEIKR